MRILLALALLLALPCSALLAGEPAKKDKAARIKWLEDDLPSARAAYAEWKKDHKDTPKDIAVPHPDKWAEGLRLRIAAQELELAWLKGQITRAKLEAVVKTAQEALEKAADKDKPSAQAVLDTAKANLAAVVKLEEAGEF